VLVEEVMTEDVVSVARSASLREAVERLLTEDVGSIIVLSDEGNPVGIVTESDALEAAYRTGEALREIAVADLSHRPIVTTTRDATVPHLANEMASKGVKKAPVMDDLDLVGIVTMSDIVWHLSELRKEASSYGEAISQWQPDEE
jgi:CBS domain-containing protein